MYIPSKWNVQSNKEWKGTRRSVQKWKLFGETVSWERQRAYLQSCSDHTHLTEEEFSSSSLLVVLLQYQKNRAQKENRFHSNLDPLHYGFFFTRFQSFVSEFCIRVLYHVQCRSGSDQSECPHLQPLLLIQVIPFSDGQMCHSRHRLQYWTSASLFGFWLVVRETSGSLNHTQWGFLFPSIVPSLHPRQWSSTRKGVGAELLSMDEGARTFNGDASLVPHGEKTPPKKTQDTLEELCLPAGLEKAWGKRNF